MPSRPDCRESQFHWQQLRHIASSTGSSSGYGTEPVQQVAAPALSQFHKQWLRHRASSTGSGSGSEPVPQAAVPVQSQFHRQRFRYRASFTCSFRHRANSTGSGSGTEPVSHAVSGTEPIQQAAAPADSQFNRQRLLHRAKSAGFFLFQGLSFFVLFHRRTSSFILPHEPSCFTCSIES